MCANELNSGPRLLDLFCGAGGAAVGYHRAGFKSILGVDIAPQPNYPFHFAQTDALAYLEQPGALEGIDAIHASPPCQGYTPMTNRWGSDKAKLIEPVREALRTTGLPYVIENVVGAPLLNPVRLCGSAFGLSAHRHRLFESNVAMFSTPCHHKGPGTAVYGKADGRRLFDRADGTMLRAWGSLEEGQEALGVGWMQTVDEVREAIPPAYTEYVGGYVLKQLARCA